MLGAHPFSQLLSGGLRLISHFPPTTKSFTLQQFAALSSYTGHTKQSLCHQGCLTHPPKIISNPSIQTRLASDSTREASRAAAALKVQRLNEAHARRTRLQEFQERKRKTASWASQQPILGDTTTPAPANDSSDATQLTVTPTEGPVGDLQVGSLGLTKPCIRPARVLLFLSHPYHSMGHTMDLFKQKPKDLFNKNLFSLSPAPPQHLQV